MVQAFWRSILFQIPFTINITIRPFSRRAITGISWALLGQAGRSGCMVGSGQGECPACQARVKLTVTVVMAHMQSCLTETPRARHLMMPIRQRIKLDSYSLLPPGSLLESTASGSRTRMERASFGPPTLHLTGRRSISTISSYKWIHQSSHLTPLPLPLPNLRLLRSWL